MRFDPLPWPPVLEADKPWDPGTPLGTGYRSAVTFCDSYRVRYADDDGYRTPAESDLLSRKPKDTEPRGGTCICGASVLHCFADDPTSPVGSRMTTFDREPVADGKWFQDAGGAMTYEPGIGTYRLHECAGPEVDALAGGIPCEPEVGRTHPSKSDLGTPTLPAHVPPEMSTACQEGRHWAPERPQGSCSGKRLTPGYEWKPCECPTCHNGQEVKP
jgi:hypothetical protein